jgi:hypothetical protein
MAKPKRAKKILDPAAVPSSPPKPAPLSGKLGSLQALVERDEGATIGEMMAATGWQAHSVRGAISGSLRKVRGIDVISELKDGERRYRVGGTT